MGNRWGNSGNSGWLYFWGAPKSLQKMTTAMKWKDTCSLEEKLTNLDSILKSRDITLLTKVRIVKAMVFPVVTYGCESWTIKLSAKDSCFWTVMLENFWESLGLQGDQTWILIGRTDAEAEIPILWPPEIKSQLTGKDPDAGKDWRQKERWLDSITNSTDTNLSKLREILIVEEPGVLQSMT